MIATRIVSSMSPKLKLRLTKPQLAATQIIRSYGIVMNNTERLLLQTLPRWAGVTVLTVKEPLSDMWISGAQASHHMELPYDPDGCEALRTELLKDFVHAPAADAFRSSGSIRTIRDLDAAMANTCQTPVPSPSALLAALLPRDELATLTLSLPCSATLIHPGKNAQLTKTRRSKVANPTRTGRSRDASKMP